MNAETLDMVVRLVLSGCLGYALGAVTQYRWASVRGRRLLVPYIPDSGRRVTLVLLVLAVVTTGTVLSGALERHKSAECAREFRHALSYQSALADEDRSLDRRFRELYEIRTDASDDMVEALAGSGDGGEYDPEVVRVELSKYLGVVDREHLERERLDEKRADIEREREANPIPPIKCGN